MPLNDPVMAVQDRLPLASAPAPAPTSAPTSDPAAGAQDAPKPFGLRWAVTPVVPGSKHEKTYYTVTVKEATQVSRDGRVETVQDDVQRERED